MGNCISTILDNEEWLWDYESIYISPNIPTKKLSSAIQSYAPTIMPDDVLALLDDTVFGGSKEGLILSKKGLYSKELFQKPKKISIDEIKSINVVSKNRIIVNGDEFFKSVVVDKSVIEKLVFRISTVLDIKEGNIEIKPSKKESQKLASVNSFTDKFGIMHNNSLLKFQSEFGKGAFLLDDLIDREINIILSLNIDFQKIVVDSSTKALGNTEIEAESVETCLILFLIMHFYSISNISDDFKRGLGDNYISLLSLSSFYAGLFREDFKSLFHRDMLDEDALATIPGVLCYMDDKRDFFRDKSKDQVFIMLLDEFGIPSELASRCVVDFESSVNWWVDSLIKEMS